MQRYVTSNAQKVIVTGAQQRNSEPRSRHSKHNQTTASPMRIQVSGKAYEPVEWKINAATSIKTTSPSAAVAGVGDPGFRRKASPAQIASTRWKNGSQRKLQRNKPAVGVMQSKSTSNSSTSSHLICLTSWRARQRSPAISAEGATNPQANSAAVCGRPREEKSVQCTVHDGRINPGSAAGGTRHCQCAAAACNSRAEPWTRSRSPSHAGAERPKPSTTPMSSGSIEKMFRVWTSDLIDNHAMRSSSIKTV